MCYWPYHSLFQIKKGITTTRSGVAGLYVDNQHIYYSLIEITLCKKRILPKNANGDESKKYIVRKCTYDGTVVAKYDRCGDFIRCIGQDDEGYIYVLCKNSEVVKLDKNLNFVNKTNNDCVRYLRQAHGMLVLSENVLVASGFQNICVLDLNLEFCYSMRELNIVPIGFAKFQTNKFIVTAKSAIEIFEIDFHNRELKNQITLTNMSVGNESVPFNSNYVLRGICTSSDEYIIYVTEMDNPTNDGRNGFHGGRLLCFQFADGKLRHVCEDKQFSDNCCENFSENEKPCGPVAVFYHDGKIYYSQGCFGKMFHIVKTTHTAEGFMDTKLLFDAY